MLGTAGAGWLYIEHLNGNLRKDDLNLGDKNMQHTPNAAGQTPLNILILGSDSRKSKENQKLGGARQDADRPPLADVQMLVHLSADRSNASVISLPRDTRLRIPACHDKEDGKTYQPMENTANESLGRGGPGCTVAMWYELTRIPIDHFMMLDFGGVVRMADAVGGVPVCVDANVHSKDSSGHGSGLRLEKGTTKVKGVQALQWLRTRYGFEDNTDIGRTHAQHMYMNSMVRQLKAGTKLTDPGKLTSLAEASTKALTVDRGLDTVKKLYDLGTQLKSIPAKRITMTTMPWVLDPRNNAHVIPKPGDAEKLFSLVRNDVPLDGKGKKKPEKAPKSKTPKDQVDALVVNSSGTQTLPPATHRAADVTAHLVSQGFTKVVSGGSGQARSESTVTYAAPGQKADAQVIAKSLGLPSSAVERSTTSTAITVIVGADWREGTTYPEAARKKREKDGAPDSAAALRGDDSKACMHVNPSYTW
ncbi:LCP family protein [Wenjunlia tyrosinilytica]|uniref:LCP family protein n=1 Tax=Wenjunlia tyrosinilytica TaxID=1544741 RepID=UPI0027E520A1|nr:LCP family protein [Wenjunlia tyrosinilytica]